MGNYRGKTKFMSSVKLSLREISVDDAELIFGWRNDPEIVSLGTTNKTVDWEVHTKWITNSINNSERRIYLIHLDDVAAGQIRFDRQENNSAVISVYLTHEFRGKGFGNKAISQGSDLIFKDWSNLIRVIAHIKSDNIGSIQSFEKAGFIENQLSDTPKDHTTRILINKFQKIPHNRLTFGDEEIKAAQSVVASGYWVSGAQVDILEESCSKIANMKFGKAVSSGYAALRLGLLSLGIGPGKEVIIPGYSCVALANAVLATGAKPIPVDIDSKSLNITKDTIYPKLNKNTAAIIAVHTFGLPANIKELRDIGIPIIEDCSHCFGLVTPWGPIGSLGDISIISFYATKLVGGGKGGMVMTNQESISDFIEDYRDYTDKSPSAFRMNDKMHNIEAVLSLEQLKKLPAMISSRQQIALEYHKNFSDLPASIISIPDINTIRIWYRFTVLLNKSVDELIVALSSEGISTDKPISDWTEGVSDILESKRAYQNILSLPCYPTLTGEEQTRIIQTIKKHLLA
jgi:perosamine synthetase